MMGISPSPQPSPSGRGGTCRAKVSALRESQVKSGEELRPFVGRTLTSSPNEVSGISNTPDKTLKGKP